jgi:mono/diheme cytochrome c family protein
VRRTFAGSFLVVAIACSGAACDRAPSGEAQEWTAKDHDRREESKAVKAGTQASAQPKGSGSKANDDRTLVELTWRQACVSCHGVLGRGDGPSGPMVQAPDLTRADWQGKVKDEEIAATIKNGKNKMPKFDLPDRVVAGLVARIRASAGAGADDVPGK